MNHVKCKPIIGILPSYNPMTGDTKLPAGYTKAVIACGGIPFIFSFLEEENDIRALAEKCDGFIFSGGVDPDPRFYGEEKLNDTVEICDCRDLLEFKMLKIALELDKPILGVCRGIQLMNIALGGTLYQDLPAQMPDTSVCHRQKGLYPNDGHFVTVEDGTPLCSMNAEKRLFVNTYHHQAIKRLAPSLCVMAAADDGIVEAAYLQGKPHIFGVQWHPELLYDSNECAAGIFHYFIQAAEDKMTGNR